MRSAWMVGWVGMLAARSAGHSSLINPISRNSVDRTLPQWANGHFGNGTHCAHPAHEQRDGICWGCNCTNGTTPCTIGQTCLWFSEGCSIGCKSCDGNAKGPSNPNTKDRCNSGKVATNNDPRFRTYHRDVPALSKGDVFRWNPWRAPGNAPVYDPCGMAGGSPTWEPTQLSFRNTINAVQGDLGSKVLPKTPTGIVWKAGDEVEAVWSVRANHGGGYQYRLCPSEDTLTEACFREIAVEFAGKTSLLWGDGSRMAINGTFLSEGTEPVGSSWAMMPLPFSDNSTAVEFEPPCDESVSRHANDTGRCSGRFPYAVSIADTLVVPPSVKPGEYVLQLRYDCEATAQVWSQCSDITIA